MTELHQCKAALGTERVAAINYSKDCARARAIAITINHEGMPHPTFPRASQNIAAVVALLDILPTPSIDEVGKVYEQLKGILGVATEQQAVNLLH
jgi:hypothetical protein